MFFQGKGTHAELMGNLPADFRLLTLGTGLLFFVWRSIVPWDLTFHYVYPPGFPPLHLLAWAIVGIAVVTVWLYRKSHPNVFFSVVWFLVCLLPSSGIVYVGTSFTADRYTYLALTGAFAMIGLWAAQPGKFRLLKLGVVGLAIAGMTFLSIQQCATWRDGWALFSHAVKVQPRNPVALGNLGGMYQQAGNHEEAMTLYRRVLDLYPSDAMAWFNLGNSLRDTGDAVGAVQAFRKSVESRPGFSNAWRNLGLMLASGDPVVADPLGARKAFLEALQASNQRDPIAILLLADAEFQLGQTGRAAELLKVLEAYHPTDPGVMAHLKKLRDQVESKARD
jgi:Tfp pilus assembly protein PilF